MSEPTLYAYRVKTITRVVDGDTFDCIIDLGFNVLLEGRVRMAGIDTPESRTADDTEKVFGLASKEYLKEHLSHATIVIVKTEIDNEQEKFGRILGHVFADGVNINKKMCEDGYAVAYWGQNKQDVQDEHQVNRQRLLNEGRVKL